MPRPLLEAYDRLLDENDWDIYYWATQQHVDQSQPQPQSQSQAPAVVEPRQGEWAGTVGSFQPAYRPVPERWRGSVMVEMLRQHVHRRSHGGEGGDERGLGFMPPLRS